MQMTKRVVTTAGVAAGVVGVVAAGATETALGRSVRGLARRLARDIRYAVSSAPGIAYRLAGRRPDPDVTDDVLADRIRSSIGSLEKSLDVPRVRVAVEDHVAIVHGDVGDADDAHAITHAIMAVSGVRGVESHLHAGLLPGDTRPSAGRAQAGPSSPALVSLLAAAERHGATDPRAAVHAVLGAFADRIPPDEREHVLAHLPRDVRSLAGPPHRHGEHPRRVRTVEELVVRAMSEGGLDRSRASDITRAVVAALKALVPDEARDVSAILPEELRTLWESDPSCAAG